MALFKKREKQTIEDIVLDIDTAGMSEAEIAGCWQNTTGNPRSGTSCPKS